ncbi:hypothetical protein H0H81_004024 [Sphagnurus paluster]|uniref:HMG box domain-containing protein n=1 Tax=Sphagnurus paluster TaxID=117069 RepID=A0A9P7KML4_9AGAR|nr:hypothetical protein H0H81_004024 [Sphagnurus paluster]
MYNPAQTDQKIGMSSSPKQKKNKIPRPMNCFMLYRQQLLRNQSLPDLPKLGTDESRSGWVAQKWHNETPETKATFKKLAQEIKREHERKYPGYKFSPVHRETKEKLKWTKDSRARESVREASSKITDSSFGVATGSNQRQPENGFERRVSVAMGLSPSWEPAMHLSPEWSPRYSSSSFSSPHSGATCSNLYSPCSTTRSLSPFSCVSPQQSTSMLTPSYSPNAAAGEQFEHWVNQCRSAHQAPFSIDTYAELASTYQDCWSVIRYNREEDARRSSRSYEEQLYTADIASEPISLPTIPAISTLWNMNESHSGAQPSLLLSTEEDSLAPKPDTWREELDLDAILSCFGEPFTTQNVEER